MKRSPLSERGVIDWPGFWPATYFAPALVVAWLGGADWLAVWEGVRTATLTVGVAVGLGTFPTTAEEPTP